ncbi:MAG: hypothetical protein ABIU06_08520, partial [Anaerolineales bacterium]
WLGALLFLAGVLIGLSLSAAVVWGESEARIYTSYNGNTRFKIKCPLMLSPVESGVVGADIINPTDEEIIPVVSVEVSHTKIPRKASETLTLAPGEAETVQWTVDPSDVIFERLILVNIHQSQYRDNPSHLGSCGIFIFSLLGLTGAQTFALVFAVSLIAMLSGAALWLYARWPLNRLATNIAQLSTVLLVITILALLTTIPRLWGLTLILDALILLIFGVIITEFGLFSQKYSTNL